MTSADVDAEPVLAAKTVTAAEDPATNGSDVPRDVSVRFTSAGGELTETVPLETKALSDSLVSGVWPPGSPPGALLKQENMLVVPAAFSPLK